MEQFVPFIEVSGNVDVTALTRRCTDAEELHERGCTRLGRFLIAQEGMDGIFSTVNGNFAELRANVGFTRLAVPVIHDVVFNLRIHGPTVNTDIAVLGATGLRIFVIDRIILCLVIDTRAIVTIAITHASQEVLVVAPVSLERTVVEVAHVVAATLRPLFEAPRGTIDRTGLVALNTMFATASLGHFVLAGIDCESAGNTKPEGQCKSCPQNTTFHFLLLIK